MECYERKRFLRLASVRYIMAQVIYESKSLLMKKSAMWGRASCSMELIWKMDLVFPVHINFGPDQRSVPDGIFGFRPYCP